MKADSNIFPSQLPNISGPGTDRMTDYAGNILVLDNKPILEKPLSLPCAPPTPPPLYFLCCLFVVVFLNPILKKLLKLPGYFLKSTVQTLTHNNPMRY